VAAEREAKLDAALDEIGRLRLLLETMATEQGAEFAKGYAAGASRGDRHELAAFLMDALNRHGASYGLPRDPSDLAYSLADELASRGEAPPLDYDARDEAVRRTLLYVLQLSNAENKRLNAAGGQRFIDALEQVGYTVVRAAGAPPSPQTPSLEPEQCPDRCGGIVGHSGPHQSSDYDPAIRASLVRLVDHLTLRPDEQPDPHHMNDGCVKAARTALAESGAAR
jgi:hypothetical protein